MQTIYYSTPNFIRHTGNVVDLAEYRRKLSLAQEGSLAPQPRYEESRDFDYDCPWPVRAAEEPRLRLVTEAPAPDPAARRSLSRQRRAWVLDICASLGIVAMTLTFTVQILTL